MRWHLSLVSTSFAAYFWPALIIWGLDRIIRVSYLIWKNRMWYWKTSDKDLAHVELLSNDMVRLTLRRKMHWEAGQHAYLILPSLSKLPSEAHPFTSHLCAINDAFYVTYGGFAKCSGHFILHFYFSLRRKMIDRAVCYVYTVLKVSVLRLVCWWVVSIGSSRIYGSETIILLC